MLVAYMFAVLIGSAASVALASAMQCGWAITLLFIPVGASLATFLAALSLLAASESSTVPKPRFPGIFAKLGH
jgi:hypothetical protein